MPTDARLGGFFDFLLKISIIRVFYDVIDSIRHKIINTGPFPTI